MLYSGAGTGISKVLLLATMVLAARYLGPLGFGEYGAVQATVVTLSSLASLGLGLASTRYVGVYLGADSARVERVVGFSLAVTLVAAGATAIAVLASARTVASLMIGNGALTPSLRMAAPWLFLSSVQIVQLGILTGFAAFRRVGIVMTSSAFFMLLAVPLGARVAGPFGSLIGTTMATAAACVVAHFAVAGEMRQRGLRMRLAIDRGSLSMLSRFGAPAVAADASVNLAVTAAIFLMLRSPGGLTQVGLFRAATQWHNAALLAAGVLGTVFMPLLAERLGAGDWHTAVKMTRRVTAMITIVGLPLAGLVTLLSPRLMAINGAAFAGGGPVLAVMIWTAALQSIQAPVACVVQASGQMWLGALMNIGWGVALMSFFWIVPHMDAQGLAWARLGAYALHLGWTSLFAFAYFRPRAASVSLTTCECTTVSYK